MICPRCGYNSEQEQQGTLAAQYGIGQGRPDIASKYPSAPGLNIGSGLQEPREQLPPPLLEPPLSTAPINRQRLGPGGIQPGIPNIAPSPKRYIVGPGGQHNWGNIDPTTGKPRIERRIMGTRKVSLRR